MFIFLSKLLPVLFFPVGLAGLLLLLAYFLKKVRWQRRLLLAAGLLIWFFGNSWVSSSLVRSLEWRYLPEDAYPEVDAIVILGGATLPADYPRKTVELNYAGDRILYGAQLYLEGRAPVILVTGGNVPWADAVQSPAEDMLDLLVFLGVPEEAVILEGDSANTYENALFSKPALEAIGANRILLVTSAMHMPRSVPLFEKQGFTVIPAPTDFSVTSRPNTKPLSETWPDYFFSLFPSSFALNDSTLALKEYIGIAVYGLRGWY